MAKFSSAHWLSLAAYSTSPQLPSQLHATADVAAVISPAEMVPMNLTPGLCKLITIPIIRNTKHWLQYLFMV